MIAFPRLFDVLMRSCPVVVLMFVLLSLSATDAYSQQMPAELSDEAEITLITILPGNDIPSMYGHTAFRLIDPIHGVDLTFNYGTYDFQDPFFIPKFMYGDMEYFLGVVDFDLARRGYEFQERPIIEQRLNLTTEDRNELYRLLQYEARPENRYYQYDFFFDNCTTRPRDALAVAVAADINYPQMDEPQTFRELIAPYAADRPFLDLGMNTLLGPRTDRVADSWDRLFLPDHLMWAAEEATIDRNGGEPLVTQTDTLFWADGYERGEASANWPLFLGWLIFAVGAAVTLFQVQTRRAFHPLPDALFLFFVGLVGLLVTFLTFISLHDVARYNLHLLWAWPTHLIAAAALLRGNSSMFFRGYLIAAAVASLLMAAAWFLLPQVMPAALWPIALLLAMRCLWLGYSHVGEQVGEAQRSELRRRKAAN